MGFPSNNANTHGHHRNGAHISDSVNWFKTPAAVDASGMEFSFGLAKTYAGHASSVISIQCTDGATTGIGTDALFTAVTNSGGTAWTDLTVRNQAGTTTTDLDADDVVNLVTVTGMSTAGSGQTNAVAYIYGKPGAIN